MSRKRNCSFAETSLSPPPHGALMEPSGSASRADGDFLELEPDEELLFSVNDITEHLGRNITLVLETALSEIRKMVSIRIRVLKMELREKTEEIDVLKARLDTVQRDGRDHFPSAATAEPSAESGHRKPNNADPRRVKGVMTAVKKENIDAICDYLMKDKNSRGGTEMDGDQSSQTSGEREARPEQDPHPLALWPDSGMAGPGSGHGDSESTTDDIFSMLPSGSKRMYDYEWITPIEYSSDLKVMKDPDCDNTLTGETDDDDDDEEDETSRREGDGLDQAQVPLSHVQPSDFTVEPLSSSGDGGSPLEGNTDKPEAGRCPFRQYMPSKPAKYGIKSWVVCDAKSSYARKMQVYTGKPSGGRIPRTEASAAVVKTVKAAAAARRALDHDHDHDHDDDDTRPERPAAPLALALQRPVRPAAPLALALQQQPERPASSLALVAAAAAPLGASKRKRCQICPTKKDCKTHTVCRGCNRYICKGCSLVYCPTCAC
ncbi:zinc finger protein 16-like isoform X2 [Hippoglossus stenolepis]|uniref:zinc finger protein 16-like isoform X2 n=1 Tax=Hippoglossus stenolepis TaxID=195615 RepID=UPI001FAEC0B1|nr:zinc finger protein 16-like isoform X2 [Hippoglossus stenolepis]